MSQILDRLRSALSTRAYAYKTTFKGPLAETVLRDISTFCFAHQSTFHEDARKHALAEGRREVWDRIAAHLHMTPEQLWNLYDGRQE